LVFIFGSASSGRKRTVSSDHIGLNLLVESRDDPVRSITRRLTEIRYRLAAVTFRTGTLCNYRRPCRHSCGATETALCRRAAGGSLGAEEGSANATRSIDYRQVGAAFAPDDRWSVSTETTASILRFCFVLQRKPRANYTPDCNEQ